TLNDLCGNVRSFQAELRADAFLDVWIEVRKGPDSSAYLSDRHDILRIREAFPIPLHLGIPQRPNQTERGRLGMDPMRSPDLWRVLEFKGSAFKYIHQAVDLLEEDFTRLF